jgi:hypothetical protein
MNLWGGRVLAAVALFGAAILLGHFLSAPLLVYASGVPSTVSDLSGASNDTSVTLGWTTPANNGASITDYSLQYRVTGSSSWTTFSHSALASSTVTITGLNDSENYDFQVAAINSFGTATYSNIATVMPLPLFFSDNFESEIAGLISGQNSWVSAGNSTTWSVITGDGGHVLSQTATDNTDMFNTDYVNNSSTLSLNQRLKVDFQAGCCTVHLDLRKTGLTADPAEYLLLVTPGGLAALLYHSQNSGAAFTVFVSSSTPITQTTGNWYTLEFSVVNNASGSPVLSSWIYPQGTSRPVLPFLTYTDTAKDLPGAGYAGLAVSDFPDQATFDNFTLYGTDAVAPVVSVTAPTNGANVSGTMVNLSATATDNIAVRSVQFQIDGSNVGVLQTSPTSGSTYSTTFDSTALMLGSHTVTAIATDTSGNATTSASVSINVLSPGVVITSPARAVAGAPNVATIAVTDELAPTYYIPYIQTASTLNVSASVGSNLPSGGGVKFILTNTTTLATTTQYSMSAPFNAAFAGLAKGTYTLDAYVVDNTRTVVSGTLNHDQATSIGIGDIITAMGDSITEGDLGTNYGTTTITSWLNAPAGTTSNDNRNYPQYGHIAAVYQHGWQIEMNNELEQDYGYPVFIRNEGWAGYKASDYINLMQTNSIWQSSQAALAPDKWVIQLGVNDGAFAVGTSTYQANYQSIINTLETSYNANPNNIYLSRFNYITDGDISSYLPTVATLVVTNGLKNGPDFYDHYAAYYSTQYADHVHPNATGYLAMAHLWALSLISPGGFSLANATSGVRATWNSLSSVEPTIAGYKIKYGTTSSTYSTTIDEGNATSATITGLTSNTNYYFTVQAYDNDPSSVNFSDTAPQQSLVYVPVTVPAVPTAASVTIGVSSGGGGFGTGTGSYIPPIPSPSSTVALQATLKNLMAQLGSLLVQAKSAGITVGSTTESYIFSNNLKLFDVSMDVEMLQKYLNAKGFVLSQNGVGSPGNETEKFGALTWKELEAFQESVGIVPASGYFGPITRAYVNSHE